MNINVSDWFTFDNYGELVQLVAPSLLAAALLAVVAGFMSVFITRRDLAFAVHGVSELSFAGAAFALLVGADVVHGSIVGSILAALIIGLLGERSRSRNSVVGVLMPFGLGLALLFLALYEGRAANKFGLLNGQIVSITPDQLRLLVVLAAVVLVTLAVIWRPLSFATIEPTIARVRGVPVRLLDLVFMLLLGLSVALAVQVVGVLLVLALLITPAAAASYVAKGPLAISLLSVAFAAVSSVGGILLALTSPASPISSFVTTLSFLIYVVCRIIAAVRARAGSRGSSPAAA